MKKFFKNAMAYPMAQQTATTGSNSSHNNYHNNGQQQPPYGTTNAPPTYYSASAYSHTAAPAANGSQGPPPPLSDLNRWFDYYDRDRSGSLDREELVNALVRTYQSNDPQSIRETVFSIFPAFDSNGSGSIDRYEFTSPGGLGESLLSAMQQMERHPPPYAPSFSNTAASTSSTTAIGGSTWDCPNCTFTNFNTKSTCGMCGAAQPAAMSPRSPNTSSYTTAAAFPPAPTFQAPELQYQIMKATIPPGMGPGQKIKVQTPSGMFMVAIPDRSKWVNNTFDFKVPITAPVATAAAPIATPVAPTASSSYYSNLPQQQQQQWLSFTQFQGGERYYRHPPLQMIRVPVTLTPVRASGRRRALLIGINYPGTRAALRGCVNDARNIQRLLLRHGYPNDSSHMVMLTDDTRDKNYVPTGDNIFKALQWLVQGVSEGDVLFFHYSGHGAQVKDKSGMEVDGMNETILPSDYKRRQITDDELWGNIVYPLPSGVRLTAIMDCCHSGTGLDLPYDYSFASGGKNGKRSGLLSSFLDMSLNDGGGYGQAQGRWVADPNPAHSQGDVVLFSGCQDSQTSADTIDKYQAGGAMTQSFISAYEENPGATYAELLALIHKSLRRRNFSQRPQLTSSQTFDVQNRRFSLTDGIEPNHNEMIGRTQTHHFKPGRPGGGLDDLFGGNLGTVAAVAIGAALLSDLF